MENNTKNIMNTEIGMLLFNNERVDCDSIDITAIRRLSQEPAYEWKIENVDTKTINKYWEDKITQSFKRFDINIYGLDEFDEIEAKEVLNDSKILKIEYKYDFGNVENGVTVYGISKKMVLDAEITDNDKELINSFSEDLDDE